MKETKMWNILAVLVSSEQSQWVSNNRLYLKSFALCRVLILTVRPNVAFVRWQLQLDLWLISTVMLVSPPRYIQISGFSSTCDSI